MAETPPHDLGEAEVVAVELLRDGEGPAEPDVGFNGVRIALRLPDGRLHETMLGFRPTADGSVETFVIPHPEEGELAQ
jgi:hypothetical protein